MELRILFRIGEEDADGRCAGYQYKTLVVEVPSQFLKNKSDYLLHPEVIGGEWIEEQQP